jgi:hypothetical protein
VFTLQLSAACIVTQPVNATICAGGSTTFSVAATGAVGYQWQVNMGSGFADITTAGVNPQYGNNSWTLPTLQVNNISASNDGYQYRCIVCCGSCITADTTVIVILTVYAGVPAQPSAVSGLAAPCKNETGLIYSVSNIPGVNYIWTKPGGWTIISGQNTHSIVINAGASSGNITVTPTNSCGSGPSISLAVTTVSIPLQPSVISGTTNPCQNAAGLIYSVTKTAGVTYTWSLPADWNIISGQGTDSLRADAGANGGNITVTPSNACGNGPSRSLAVSPITLPLQPSAITGSPAPCQGSSQNYWVTNVSGVSYAWTFPTLWSHTSGGITDSATVTVGADSGNIMVTPSNACGNGPSQTMAVTPVTLPSQTDSIIGSITPCPGSSQIYHVTKEAGVSYVWTFPSGWSQAAGGITDSVIVTVGSGSGNITVTPSNVCGNGPSQILTVTPISLPSQPSAITGSLIPCQGSSQIYLVTNVSGVSYAWTFPTLWSQTAGGIADSVTVMVGADSGNITVTPSNVCGNGPSQILTVTPI